MTNSPTPTPHDDFPGEPTDEPLDEAGLDEIDRALGRSRDPDKFSAYLDRLFNMAGRRRITFGVLAVLFVVGLIGAAVWAVGNDAGLGSLIGEDTNFGLTESDGFEDRDPIEASDQPDLSAADSAVLTQLVAVTDGDSPRIDRVVVDPDPSLFVVGPGVVRASLMTFRNIPSVALVGPASWYAGACIEITVLDSSGEPSAPVWVAAELGVCGGQASGVGVVPRCAGPTALIVVLPEAPEAPSDDDEVQSSVAVDVFAPTPDFESLLVTTTIPVAVPTPRWPAAIADDGAEVRLLGLPNEFGEGEATCLVG